MHKREQKKFRFPPGFELGTTRSEGERGDHYTNKTVRKKVKFYGYD